MTTDEILLELIKNELPDSERQAVIESLAGSASLQEDFSILLKMEQGINSLMENIAEPEETAADLFGKLGYSHAIPAAEPEPVRSVRLSLNVVISLISILVVLLTVLLLSGLVNSNGEPAGLQGQAYTSNTVANLAGVTDKKYPPIPNTAKSINNENTNRAGNKRYLPPVGNKKVIASVGNNDAYLNTNETNDNPELSVSNDRIKTDGDEKATDLAAVDGFSQDMPDLRELADSNFEEAIKGQEESAEGNDFSLEMNFHQGYFINKGGIKGNNFNMPENAMLTAYYNFGRHFSAGLAYSRDIFRIGDNKFNPSSFGIALGFTGNEYSGFAPAGRIFAGVNEPGALLKINTGINYRVNNNTTMFFGIGFQDFFIFNTNNIIDSKKIGFEIGIKVSF